MDKLDKIFMLQSKFMKNLGLIPKNRKNPLDRIDHSYIKLCMFYIIQELMEAAQHLNKPWKNPNVVNKKEFKEELIDAFHFFIELFILIKLDSTDIHNSYCKKMETNTRRQKEGY